MSLGPFTRESSELSVVILEGGQREGQYCTEGTRRGECRRGGCSALALRLDLPGFIFPFAFSLYVLWREYWGDVVVSLSTLGKTV